MNLIGSLARFARKDRAFLFGAFVVALALLLAATGQWLAPYDPESTSPDVLLAPSGSHWFGTDDVGMDIFSRTLAAFRVDVLIALVAVGISMLLGTLLGAFTGYPFESRFARAASWSALRLADMVQSFPVLVMALVLVATFGPTIPNIVAAIAFVCVPAFMRITRGSVLVETSAAYVEAARVMGVPARTTLLRHVLPNSIDATIANGSISIGVGILLTAGLSYVGAGVRAPTPEWGVMMSKGSDQLISGAWWPSVLPGLALLITVSGFALLGDGIRRFLDPTARQANLLSTDKAVV